MIIVNLNIRGLRGSTKARYMRQIIACEGAKFVCIQETKAKVLSDAKCYSVWGDNKIGWLHYEGVNGSGSLLSMWYKEAFNYMSHLMGKGFIVVFGNYLKFKITCAVVNVYANCNLNDKKMLWTKLSNIKANSQVTVWCFCGDFNAIRSCSERKGSQGRDDHSSEIRGFNTFIDSNLLLDLLIVGKKFTWFKSNGSAKSRLDKVLVSLEWMDKWPMCKQYVQPMEVSDHCAIVVKSMDKDWGPRPFRTIDAWLTERGFSEMVKNNWNSYSVQGNALVRFKEKLKCLKEDLKVWNMDVFGNINTMERVRRWELVIRMKEIDKKLDSLICQKARARWLKNGDLCTRFYHSTLRWRGLRNEVKGVEVGGQWCEEPSTVRFEAKKLFENRFKATRDLGVRLDAVEFKSLSAEENLSLIASFTEKEIRDAV
ncbi:uncharacterized protein [Phaseolus vulgaris]|uniref:uncharacterized protein n=1 Tax=Phaseolus vulgaris TaxID=3885 RepID=UPI0035CB394F